MDIGLTYDTNYEMLQKAKQVLATILAETEFVEDDPTIRFDSFGDSALMLKVIYWVSEVSEYFGKVAEINERKAAIQAQLAEMD